ncbi:MAG TPA: hypothetical protein VGG58_06875 [Candidatus Acidoferrum sp.]|jgi:hypothetical protein
MLFATILLLCPLPQIEGTAKSVENIPAAITISAESADSANLPSSNASLSQPVPLPSAPEPKVKTDAEIEPGIIAAVAPGAPHRGVKAAIERPTETPTQRKLWYTLAFTGSSAAVFDAWSTRRAISGAYGVEGNPMLRPFSHSNAMYAATQVSPLVMDFIGKRMMTSRHHWMRSLWWLPQSAGTSVSVYAGVHNTRLVP